MSVRFIDDKTILLMLSCCMSFPDLAMHTCISIRSSRFSGMPTKNV